MLPAEAVAASGSPFSLFVETYWSHEPALLVAAFAAVSALGTLNGWTLIQAELPATLARQGLLPGWFARTHRHGTPANALILSSALATACVILNDNKSPAEMFHCMAVMSTPVTLGLLFPLPCAHLGPGAPITAAALAP